MTTSGPAATFVAEAVSEAGNDNLRELLAAINDGDDTEAGELLADIIHCYGRTLLQSRLIETYNPGEADGRAREARAINAERGL